MVLRSTLVLANVLGLVWFAASMQPGPSPGIRPIVKPVPIAKPSIDWTEHRTHCRTEYMKRFGPGFTVERSEQHLYNVNGAAFSTCQAAEAGWAFYESHASQLRSCVFAFIPRGYVFCNLGPLDGPKSLGKVRCFVTERGLLRLEGVVFVGADYTLPLVFEFREQGDDLVFTGMGATGALRYIAGGKEFEAAHITWHTDANEVEVQGTLLYKQPFTGAEMDGAGHIDFYFAALRK